MKDEKEEKEARRRHGLVPADDWGWFADPFPRWFTDPFRGMHGNMLGEFFSEGLTVPRVDIKDKGNSFVVEADMPSVDKKDIDLKVSDDTITIKAEKTRTEERSDGSFYSKERSSSGYYRMVRLPEEVDASSAKASYKDGTLTIEVKKAKGTATHEVKVE